MLILSLWYFLQQKIETLSHKDKNLLLLVEMGFSTEEAASAVDRCGVYLPFSVTFVFSFAHFHWQTIQKTKTFSLASCSNACFLILLFTTGTMLICYEQSGFKIWYFIAFSSAFAYIATTIAIFILCIFLIVFIRVFSQFIYCCWENLFLLQLT